VTSNIVTRTHTHMFDVDIALDVVMTLIPIGLAQWLGRRSLAGGLSLTCA